MGIYEMLTGNKTPWLDANRGKLLSMAAGMATKGDLGQSLAAGIQNMPAGAQMDVMAQQRQMEEQQRLQGINQANEQKNRTLEYLRSKGRDDLLAAVDGGMSVGEAWKMALSPQNGKGSYTTPFQAVDEQGNPVYLQADSSGNVKPLEGYTPNNPIKTINTKTEQLVIDSRTGQVISSTPINNQQAAFETEVGKGLGKDQAAVTNQAASVGSKMEGLRGVVDELRKLSETATYTIPGQIIDEGRKQLGMDPSQAAIDRAKYIAIVDNQVLPLLKDTFGAAFTVEEGKSLRATLGDPNKSPAEKQAVLEAFIAQKERDLQALQVQAGQVPAPTTPVPASLGDLKNKYGLD